MEDGISIPANESNGAPMTGVDDYGRRSPGRDNGPRRSSRSRSPGARGDDRDRGDRDQGGRGDGRTNPGNNLHVSGLSHKIDTRDLEAAFKEFGRVQKASVMYDPHTRESRGFGFVTMESPEEAEAAVNGLNGTELQGKIIRVEKARRGRARTPTPGRYYGPPKRFDSERPYDPRPYDNRHGGRGGGGGGGGRDRYDEPRRDYDRGGYRDYDRGSYRDYDRGGDRPSYGGGGRGDREYDSRRYDDRRAAPAAAEPRY
ncbi:RNA-binding domain-containing protein [Schizophyllum commune Loenen D]|nr:RNA-binding domain-containing protein [Schizophyllum commune Loenen D]